MILISFQIAVIEGAYILTEDKDFGDELVYKKGTHNGAMLLRLAGVEIKKEKRTCAFSI